VIPVAQVLKSFKDKNFQPAYLLLGKEKYFHDQVIQALSDVLFTDRSSRGLNRIVLHGTENSLADVVGASLSYPMMSEYKLVIVKDFNNIKSADSDAYLRYLDNPQKSNILVLSCESAANNKVFNATKNKAAIVDCKPIADHKTVQWLKERITERSMQISLSALSMLAEYTGNNLLTIDHEINKIIEYKSDHSEITENDIIAVTGMSKEYNVFTLQKALGSKNLNQGFKIGKKLMDSGENINLILAVIFSFFKKVWIVSNSTNYMELKLSDYQLKEIKNVQKNFDSISLEKILNLLNSLDRALKNSTLSDLAVLHSLCYNICRL
jgi:DNA polymerase III subunit delta